MEQRDVLSIASVDRIRFYVKRKYEHLTKDKHAEIVADAIVKIIMRQLPPLPEKLKEAVCQDLVSNIIIAKGMPVQFQDMYEASLKHCVPHDNGEWLQLLEQWREEHTLVTSQLAASNDLTVREKTNWFQRLQQGKKAALYGFGCLVIVAGVLTAQYMQQLKTEKNLSYPATAPTESTVGAEGAMSFEQLSSLPDNELPEQFQYHTVDNEKLRSYLHTRTSLLAEPQYYDAIIAAAKQFNVSPVLLFAITGQEQGFVPREHEKAEQIANNPFNVFHSWKDFNTTIEQSSEIAARTLVNLSKERPEDVDAIVWINRKYAEDPNWSKGVTSLYHKIISYIND